MTLAEIKKELETACGFNGVADVNEEQGFVFLAWDFADSISDADVARITAMCSNTDVADKGPLFFV